MMARVETFKVAPRWLLVRMETEDGVVGRGEASLKGFTKPVLAAITLFTDHLIGWDASRIEDIWATLTRFGFYRRGPVLASAVSEIDQARGDVAGEALDGHIQRWISPGLGVEIDEVAVRHADKSTDRCCDPTSRHYDGTLAGWS